jgi:site-specific DNA recombinase
MKIVAVYLRVSSDEQRENQTIKTQEDAIRRYVELAGFEVFDWYRDDGVSGTIALAQRKDGGTGLLLRGSGLQDRPSRA